jgi:DNA-binding MarR family transcriptional regulator
MHAAIASSTTLTIPASPTVVALIAAVIIVVLLLYRRSLVHDSRQAEKRADGYLRHLVLLHLQSTRSGLDYLNRLVEDLGVDEYTLRAALDRLKQEKFVIEDKNGQRGIFVRLTSKGTDWRPEAGHHSRSGY